MRKASPAVSMRRKLRYVSVFTGAGGLDLGLEAAGFSPLLCIENDPAARLTLKLNRPRVRFSKIDDVTQITGQMVAKILEIGRGELDALVGAPPCQPFSTAALWAEHGRLGFADPRSDTVVAFLELAAYLLPSVLLIENVPGFVRGSHSALPTIERFLEAINKESRTSYRLHHRLLNAADYGVPQHRNRAILVAFRDGRSFDWPKATHSEAPIRAYDALRGLQLDNPPKCSGKWTKLLPSIPEGLNYQWHTPEGGGRPIFGYRTKFWAFLLKLSKASPSWTLPASPGPATGPFHWNNRPLAAEELLRLQSFPASWKLSGDHRTQVKQIGNATPPLLAEVIGRAVAQQGFGKGFFRPLKLRIPRARKLPRPKQTKPVPKEFKRHEGAHKPHPGTGKGPKPRIQFITPNIKPDLKAA